MGIAIGPGIGPTFDSGPQEEGGSGPVTGDALLLAGGTFFLLKADGTSKLLLAK